MKYNLDMLALQETKQLETGIVETEVAPFFKRGTCVNVSQTKYNIFIGIIQIIHTDHAYSMKICQVMWKN